MVNKTCPDCRRIENEPDKKVTCKIISMNSSSRIFYSNKLFDCKNYNYTLSNISIQFIIILQCYLSVALENIVILIAYFLIFIEKLVFKLKYLYHYYLMIYKIYLFKERNHYKITTYLPCGIINKLMRKSRTRLVILHFAPIFFANVLVAIYA